MEWFGKSLTNKEARLVARYKMDSVSLTGVWPNFPSAAAPVHRGMQYGAGLLLQLMEMEEATRRRSRQKPKETLEETRRRLVGQVMKRLQQEEETDLALIL